MHAEQTTNYISVPSANMPHNDDQPSTQHGHDQSITQHDDDKSWFKAPDHICRKLYGSISDRVGEGDEIYRARMSRNHEGLLTPIDIILLVDGEGGDVQCFYSVPAHGPAAEAASSGKCVFLDSDSSADDSSEE